MSLITTVLEPNAHVKTRAQNFSSELVATLIINDPTLASSLASGVLVSNAKHLQPVSVISEGLTEPSRHHRATLLCMS